MRILTSVQKHVRSHLLGYVAVLLAVSLAPAWASVSKNSVRSKHIVNGQVKTKDLDKGAVKGKKVHVPLTLSGTVNNDPGPPFVRKGVLNIKNAGDAAGLRVLEAGSYGVEVGGALGDPHLMSDGIRIYETGDDGIQIGSDPDYPNYGLYIPSPGVSTYGLWPNTAEASGQWALFTVDSIEAGNVAASAFTVLGRVQGGASLRPGEIVTASGVAAPVPGSVTKLVRVRAASGADAVVGVVQSRMVLEPGPKKADVGMRSAPGPARAGDYVALTTMGVANVRLAAGVEVASGDRLAASSGLARAIRTTKVNGITIAEDASLVGVAIGRPNPGTKMVPVFVMPR